jgi:hypothetical protein
MLQYHVYCIIYYTSIYYIIYYINRDELFNIRRALSFKVQSTLDNPFTQWVCEGNKYLKIKFNILKI